VIVEVFIEFAISLQHSDDIVILFECITGTENIEFETAKAGRKT
jgi:hypothetical protein